MTERNEVTEEPTADSERQHNNLGNCFSPDVVFDETEECHPYPCDACHEHEQPRGECDECPECPVCTEK